ncbi:trypsin-like peptidase domain-containing protein [Singulisphaera sp. Ch08]|uniref:Serine protease n=1 Tax=Singulisphaera sp. Ch08 TaxID=3120278 RepID=A0AAU7CLT8_9BACT
MASQPRVAEAAIEAILPSGDDRQAIAETRVPPWRWICSLIITAPDGTQWLGTGWLASPRLVITAGHCVFIHGRGGWADQVDVYPARNGPLAPYHFSSTDLRSVKGWVYRQSPESDYGAIILPEPTAGLGYFGYGVLDDDDLSELLVNVYGYPTDKAPGTLWGHDRILEQVLPRTIIYDISTFGGQSGCPIFYRQAGRRYAVGIHNYGDITGNTATRITAEVFDNIEAWRDESR